MSEFYHLKISFIILFLLAFSSLTSAQNISVKIQNVTIEKAITEIQKISGKSIIVQSDRLDLGRVVSVNERNRDVQEIILSLFAQSGQEVEILNQGNSLIVSKKERPNPLEAGKNDSHSFKVTGTIREADGTPVPGAIITVVGNNAAHSISDSNGYYSIEASPSGTLAVSCMGYQSQEVAISGKGTINIVMVLSELLLDEVVVTALGIKREEKALGYAVQQVKGDDLTAAKGVDMLSSLTGKIAGLTVWNNTEFNKVPSITLRGYAPLVIIDGIPYGNMDLSKVASDDIESIDVLKGATASALYGARGGNGAVMITTKKGAAQEGLSVEVNSNTMIFSGYLAFPEVQHEYGSGWGGVYRTDYGVWGPKLDVGNKAMMWNPYTCEMEEQELTSKGKDNFKNFSQFSFTTNNNVNVTYSGKYGSFRTSLTHAFDRGQFPNEDLHKYTFFVAGNMNYKRFNLDAGATMNYRNSTNDSGAGYYSASYMYDMVIWLGTEFDVRDYKNYWEPGKEGIRQNWYDHSGWYDNPYFKAYEAISPTTKTSFNAYVNTGLKITDWLKLSTRAGFDSYTDQKVNRDAISTAYRFDPKGYYEEVISHGYSLNLDAILSAEKTWGKFHVDGLLGASMYYMYDYNIHSKTNGGLVIPAYYSLNNSADALIVYGGLVQYQMNSLYGKASVSWDNTYFLDVTGRNDKSSTMNTGSYFYPSVAGSVVLSQIFNLPSFWDFWKIRGSWTLSKTDAEVYANNNTYSIKQNIWNNLSAEYYPTSLKGGLVNPQSAVTYEVGTALDFFMKRLHLDFTYYRRIDKDFIVDGGVSEATGFTAMQVNSKEQRLMKGFELVVGGTPVKTKDWTWDIMTNFGQDRYYYYKLDEDYSSKYDWIYEGARWDWFSTHAFYDWERSPDGSIVHQAGYPVRSKFRSNPGYTGPDLVWGVSNTIRYKNWTLDFSFDGRVGGISFSRTMQMLWNSGANIESVNQWRYDNVVNGLNNYVGEGVKVVSGSVEYDSQGHIINDTREFAPNDVAVSYQDYICAYHKGASNPSAQNMVSNTFFKLRNLSLSYSVPQRFCKSLGMKGAIVGLTGTNLFLWTKEYKYADPDAGGGREDLASPSRRYLGMSAKLNF